MKKSEIIRNIKSKITALYNKNKKVFLACVSLVLILLVLLASIVFPSSKKNNESSKTETNQTLAVSEYQATLQSKLESMLLMLDEVNSVSVLVTLDGSEEINYLKDTVSETSKDGVTSTTETTVFEKNGSSTEAIVVSKKMPKVLGVLIVVNKIDSMTKFSIISSISVVLNIGESCISILQER